jgi:hypothetical protein
MVDEQGFAPVAQLDAEHEPPQRLNISARLAAIDATIADLDRAFEAKAS